MNPVDEVVRREDRPEPSEYAEYYGQYVRLVPAGDLLEILSSQFSGTLGLLGRLDESRGGHRYAPGKWSIKEVVGHLSDTERIFAYRALCFARGERTPLPGFDQDAYVPAGRFDRRSLSDVLAEWEAVRRASVTMFGGFDEAAWTSAGTANGVGMSVRAIACVIAGHEVHHLSVLRTKYLGAA